MEVAGIPTREAAGPSGCFGSKRVAPAVCGAMKATACAALLYALSAAPAMALGFGEITRHSALGQPFIADVKLIGVNSDADLRCFKANLTSLDGDRLGTLSMSLNNGDGTPRLFVGTRQAVGEPAVQLSVEYNCSQQSRRDYQILLDPEKANAPLTVNAPVVPANKTAPATRVAQSAPAVAAAGDAAVAPKKMRHHRDSDTAAIPASEIAAGPPSGLKSSTALEKKRAKRAARVFRSVLHLGDDVSVDDNLNGVEGLHLSLSHGLNGENGDLDARNPPTAAPADAAAPVAVANTDAALKELQAKITRLEAETEELKKLNAQQMADLEAARKAKEAQGGQIYLYALLALCVAAIAWLAWRSRQIQAGINHSWEEVLPGEKEEPPTSRYHTSMDEDDDFLDRPAKPKPRPMADAPDSDIDVDALDDVPSVAEPAVRRDDFMAALTRQLPGEPEAGESEYKFPGNVRQALPDAEEILDEIQQAEFWMDMQQPQRAIEILESNWGSERPSSPLPWLYLFDLYRMVDDKEKYVELAERFEHIFNGRVIPWEDREALQHQRSLEDFPVLLKKITQLWGTEEIVPFMENLLIDDRDGRRQGFDLTAYRDILFLANIAYEVRESSPPAVAHEADGLDWSTIHHL
ncbi:MAG TPA: hypothetical protein VF472_09535 [Burkholderiaceae bacterium]